MPFFHLSQNNSGGGFDFDEDRGLTQHVVVEAADAQEASARAQAAGVYYDGVADGADCECCGDRWSEPWGNGDAEPMVYGQPVARVTGAISQWMPDGKETCVHYADGRLEWFGVTK